MSNLREAAQAVVKAWYAPVQINLFESIDNLHAALEKE